MHIVCPHCETTNRLNPDRLRDRPKCGRCKGQIFFQHPLDLNAKSFELQTKHNDIPLVVDFWAPWCGPCRVMGPAFAKAASTLEPECRLAKVNTEEEPALATQFNIRSIPTLLVLLHGRELGRHSGAMGTADLEDWVRTITTA